MGTRSTIAVQHANGSVSQVYCHWDGYLEGVGKTLLQYYNTQELAEALVDHGAISSLYPRMEPVGEHSFNNPEHGTTIFYCRDRGEELRVNAYLDTIDFLENMQQEEYDYLFSNGVWQLVENSTPVSTLLEQLEA